MCPDNGLLLPHNLSTLLSPYPLIFEHDVVLYLEHLFDLLSGQVDVEFVQEL